MWYEKSVFYQIYPLGLCGAPPVNDGENVNRISRLMDWVPHITELGVDTVFFNPLFESDVHGYDTRNYAKLDCRLGKNEDFAQVCTAFHEAGIRVVLDGVFNHVGRGFWAFQDVLKNREGSPYKDWFHINFQGNSNYNDGLWYEGWEGHYELVKLNLRNSEVVDHLFDCIRGWVREFDIDGLRLDVAYCLDEDFLRSLRNFSYSLKEDFFLLGEIIHGEYRRIMNPDMLHSVTNYICYKSLYSAFNSMNLFEIGYNINNMFGPEQYTMYKGTHLLNFADNHDVTRLYSILDNKKHLKPLYGMLFAMPGIPCIYYGSEWGIEGDKKDGDLSLRPSIEKPQSNELSQFIALLAKAHKKSQALTNGSYRTVLQDNYHMIFERKTNDERVLVAINASGEPFVAHFNADAGCGTDLITGEKHDFGAGSELPPYSVSYWRVE